MTTKELKIIKNFIDLMNEKQHELEVLQADFSITRDEKDLLHQFKKAKKHAIQVIRIVKTPL